MTQFSANLGFLWKDLPLPEAIRAAHRAGFNAVECHDPFRHAIADVCDALNETGIRLISLNTIRGDQTRGENGIAALPGREAEACTAIDQALDYALRTGAQNIHVMAGRESGAAAHAVYCSNLSYACGRAAEHGITVLIEPLNAFDAPGYLLKTTGEAVAIIERVGATNLKLMFDCYHIQIMEGDICRRLEKLLPVIGHIQIAGVPDRGEPDQGEVDFSFVLRHLRELGYDRPIGAEYRPRKGLEAGLGWLDRFKAL